MSEQSPHEIRNAKQTVVESAIALLEMDPVRGAFVIDHCFRVAFGYPSRRIVLKDMKETANTLTEAIRLLRELDANAMLIAEDALQIAMRAGTTPKKTA